MSADREEFEKFVWEKRVSEQLAQDIAESAEEIFEAIEANNNRRAKMGAELLVRVTAHPLSAVSYSGAKYDIKYSDAYWQFFAAKNSHEIAKAVNEKLEWMFAEPNTTVFGTIYV